MMLQLTRLNHADALAAHRCGMRHPTTGLSEDDLSRLTGSSSSTASSGSHQSSSSSSSSAANTPAHQHNHHHDHHHPEGVVVATAADAGDEHSLHQQSPEKSLQATVKAQKHNNNNNNNNNNSKNSHNNSSSITRFSSTYLPEIINPLEWQRSRKRKERLDSSSSATQDRKLQRSNSEELLPPEASHGAADATAAAAATGAGHALKANKSADVIRRVASEDFKKTSYALYEQDLKDTEKSSEDKKQQQQQQQQSSAEAPPAADENDGSLANRQKRQQHSNEPLPPIYGETWVSGPTKDMTRRSRYETSPARSQRHSPIRSNGKYSDDSECENERRRSSERFCKSRVPPGRKAAGVTKKSGSSSGSKYLPSKRGDESSYKYDLSTLKYERRGFISKKNVAAEKPAGSDHNDNNLIDFHQQQQQQQKKTNNSTTPVVSPTPSSCGSDESTICISTGAAKIGSIPLTSAQEALPWDRSVSEDQAPMLSRRYAAVRHHPAYNIDTAAKLSKVMPYPQQQFHKSAAAQLLADDMDCLEPLDTFRAFSSLENLRPHEVMQQIIPAMMSFQSPEQRLKQVNKRLTAMKKKLAQLEEAYETRMGYRPSQAERLNDKYMKNILAELSKLRKERHELKADPMGAVGLKVSGGMDATKKLEEMQTTLAEIEQNLTDKREDSYRSETLDELTPDQLLQEKSAVQHGLLYFESLYGRPGTKDERDAARPLYDRYRQLKRMVSRSVLLSGCAAAGAPELPTILEHEAMVFESTPLQYSSNNSTETTNSPSESVAPTASSEESATTTTTTAAGAAQEATATVSSAAPDASENISALSIDQLWDQLDKTREEKKLLKRTIREFETIFEEQNGRKMLKNDRKTIEETYAQYKEKKAKTRLLQALIKKHISR